MSTLIFDAISRRSLLLEARLEFLRLLRTPSFALPALAFPVMFYLLFGVLLAKPGASVSVAHYLMATYCVFGVMAPGLFGFGVSVATERDKGLLALRRALPMPPMNYVGGKLAMAMIFAAVIFLMLATAASIFGGVRLGIAQWALLGATMVVGALPFCALGLLVGSFANGQAAPAIVNLIYLPMALLSGLWFPLTLLPALFQKFAVLWPAWHLAQLGLMSIGQPSTGSAVSHLAWLLVFTVVIGNWAGRRLNREP
ncbi:MAG TPA: ABC transporter permease [Tahibacter sp.]|uniref:ABC transporter permease n=1 Tax=Tahibacter sp. TaxID=2056211 RepID=UPI002CFE71BA|nr:ABC transporter permease [Tahibacter sp.]HSX59101.1 ABC transporter permease [Tahibacter sp.]